MVFILENLFKLYKEIKKMSKKYNGWTNYETWNFNLWITNEEEDYSQVLELAFDSADEYELSNKLETLAIEWADKIFLDLENRGICHSGFISDMVNSSIKSVNFYEVAEHLWEDRQGAIKEHDGEQTTADEFNEKTLEQIK